MGQLFVICETGFEYNDEIYHRPQSDGGKPVLVSTSEEKANKACADKNFKCFCNEFSGLRRFFYEPSEQFSDKALALLEKNKALTVSKYAGHRSRDVLEWNEGIRWQDIPMDEFKEIFDGCKLRWYEVYEVEGSL